MGVEREQDGAGKRLGGVGAERDQDGHRTALGDSDATWRDADRGEQPSHGVGGKQMREGHPQPNHMHALPEEHVEDHEEGDESEGHRCPAVPDPADDAQPLIGDDLFDRQLAQEPDPFLKRAQRPREIPAHRARDPLADQGRDEQPQERQPQGRADEPASNYRVRQVTTGDEQGDQGGHRDEHSTEDVPDAGDDDGGRDVASGEAPGPEGRVGDRDSGSTATGQQVACG